MHQKAFLFGSELNAMFVDHFFQSCGRMKSYRYRFRATVRVQIKHQIRGNVTSDWSWLLFLWWKMEKFFWKTSLPVNKYDLLMKGWWYITTLYSHGEQKSVSKCTQQVKLAVAWGSIPKMPNKRPITFAHLQLEPLLLKMNNIIT